MHAARPGVAVQGTRAREPWPTAVRRPRPPGRTCRQLPGRSQPVCNGARPPVPGMCGGVCVSPPVQARYPGHDRPVDARRRPRNGRDQGGVNGRLGTLPQGQSIRQYLDAAAISKGNVDVHVPQEDVGRNSRTGFAADLRRGPLQGCPACSENAGRRTSCAVVTQGVECTSTPARRGPIGTGSRRRLSNTTRKHELGSRNSGAVGSAVRAREPPGPAWDSINAREAGQGQKEGSCKRRRPNRPRRLAAILAAALQGCAQQAQEAGARHRQVHPR